MGPHVDRYSTMYIKAALSSRRGRLLPLHLAFTITIDLIWFCCSKLLENKSNTIFNLSSISNTPQHVIQNLVVYLIYLLYQHLCSSQEQHSTISIRDGKLYIYICPLFDSEVVYLLIRVPRLEPVSSWCGNVAKLRQMRALTPSIPVPPGVCIGVTASLPIN